MKHSILSLIFATSLISGSAFAAPLTQAEPDGSFSICVGVIVSVCYNF